MTELAARLATLTQRTVREAFAAYPNLARSAGDHSYDGHLADVGPSAVTARLAQLDRLATDLHAVDAAPQNGLTVEERADLLAASLQVSSELFDLRERRAPYVNPSWALDAGADVSSYTTRPYAPLADRVAALCRHLEGLPEWLEAAGRMLDEEVQEGTRQVTLDSAPGYASFLRSDMWEQLGELEDEGLRSRLRQVAEPAAVACERYRTLVETLRPSPDSALGGDRFCAMLAAQEGVEETVESLRARADAELDRLGAEAVEVAGRVGPGHEVADVFRLMEEDHGTADDLLPSTRAMLERLRSFWVDSGALSIPSEVRCEVRPTPSFRRWASAMYEPPGPLDPVELPHFYFVTTVQPDWSAQQAEEWLRYLNHPSLENVSVHEAYPGHFVHELHASRQPSLVRRVFWGYGFGEGWAHYTEQLAIEHGLAAGRPLLHLAQVQDALLRACRFRAAIGLHAEGMSVEDATTLIMQRGYLARLPAEREALRGSFDPMYLLYTYGKLEILRWREELSQRVGGFSERAFHDTMLGTGVPPLAVVRDVTMATLGDGVVA